MGALAEFKKNRGILGFGYAFECLKADIQYNTEAFFWNNYCKKLENSNSCTSTNTSTSNNTATTEETKSSEDNKTTDNEEKFMGDNNTPHTDSNLCPVVVKPVDKDNSNITLTFSDDNLKNNIDDAEAALSNIDSREVKLTVAALLYLGLFITPESVYKLMNPASSDADIVFVNTVVNAITGESFNTGKSCSELENVFNDVKDFRRIVEYEHNYKPIGYSPEMEGALNVVRNLIPDDVENVAKEDNDNTNKTNIFNIKADNEEEKVIINPLSFATDPKFQQMMLENNSNLNKAEYNKLEKKFKDLLTKDDGTVLKHQFNKYSDIYILDIYFQNAYKSFSIDPGHLFGLGMGILITDQYGTIHFVSVKDKDLIKKILQYELPGVDLSYDEWIYIKSKLMNDVRIYANIDMTRGEELFPNMSKEEYEKFQYKLYMLNALPWGIDNRPILPRMRIRKYNGPDDFILASDDKVKIPVLNQFNKYINPNFTIVVKGDDITIKTDNDTELVTTFTEIGTTLATPPVQNIVA